MILDDRGIEVAYVVLVAVAWVWALSQVVYAVRGPSLWRWAVACWLTTKAAFFTVAAVTWWTNHLPERAFRTALYLLVLAHAVAFGVWLTRRKQHPPGF